MFKLFQEKYISTSQAPTKAGKSIGNIAIDQQVQL
jgi:hypothetical protein